MTNFPNALEKHYLVSSVLDKSNVHTVDLHPFQLGLFDSNYYKSVGSNLPQSVFFAVGSPHTGQNRVKGKLGNFGNTNSINRSYKTPAFDTRLMSVKEAKFEKAQPVSQQPIYYLGYDGVNYCGSLTFDCNTAYYLSIQLQGNPVQAMFGRDLDEILVVKTDDCKDCANCTSKDMKEKYLTELIRQVNEENLFLNRFIKASKVIKHCPLPTPADKVDFKNYTITVCDDGSAMAMARIQSKYDFKIKRKSTQDGYSTYVSDFILEDDGVPTDYEAKSTILKGCDSCPVGSTTVAGSLIYKIQVSNFTDKDTKAEWVTEIKAISGFSTAKSAELISLENGTSTYLVKFPLNFTEPTSPIANVKFEKIGTEEAYCEMPATTYSWSTGESAYKITRKLRTTIQDPDCNASSVLLALQDYYSSDSSIVPDSVIIPETPVGDGCKTTYELEQYSELLQDGCDWVAEAKFKAVQAFNGFMWNVDLCEGYTINANGCPVPPESEDEEFVAGIRFDIIYEEELPSGAAYSIYDNLNKEPIYFSARFGVWNSADPKKEVPNVPFKQTQTWKRENLRGHSVIKNIILSGFNEGEAYYDQVSVDNAFKLIEAEGLKYGIDKNKFYDYISITYKVENTLNLSNTSFKTFKVFFYFDTNDVDTRQKLMSLINKVLSKSDISLLA